MHLLPHINKDFPEVPPHPGSLYFPAKFCSKRRNRPERCLDFFDSIGDVPGFHICPYGFSCYVPNNSSVIYCSIIVKGYFDRKKVKPKIGGEEIARISPEVAQRCWEVHCLSRDEDSPDFSWKMVDNTLHEIRKLNRDIKSQVEDINHKLDRSEEVSLQLLSDRISNVYGTSSLLSVRLNTLDLVVNPGGITATTPTLFPLYRKFEKTVHCLKNRARRERVELSLNGECYRQIYAYPILEILPYVLLENAIKYSPNEQTVDITFSDSEQSTDISVQNLGPMLQQKEIGDIWRRAERGEYAKKLGGGSGIGLFFAKEVCELHNLEINIDPSQNEKCRYDGMPYALFKVIVSVPHE